jgi:hypothetical protein
MNNILLRTVFFLSAMLALFLPTSVFALDAPSVLVKIGETVVGTDSAVKVKSTDIDIELTKTSGDLIASYLYIWTQSSDPDVLITATDAISEDGDTKLITTPASFFTGYNPPSDSNHLWYFHVKSIGIDDLSSESVIGPFIFDTVAPQATIDLADIDGQDPDNNRSDSSTVTFQIVSTADLDKVYLSNLGNIQPVTETATTTAGGFLLAENFETDPDESGASTVYVWYEDAVGNVSTVESIALTIATGEKTMTPAGVLTLGFEATQSFQINGGESDTYTWTLVDADDDVVPSAIATLEGSADTAVVTTGTSEGTFRVKAVKGEDSIYSGVITVAKLTSTRDFTLVYNSDNTSINAISLPFAGTGIETVADLYKKIEFCDGIQWWNATKQTYEGYNEWDDTTNLNLVVGAVYFIGISSTPTADLTFEGSEVSVTFSLKKNDDNTSINSISIPFNSSFTNVESVYDDIPVCDGIQWWDAGKQTYDGYNEWDSTTNGSVSNGDCFFVGVTADVSWP